MSQMVVDFLEGRLTAGVDGAYDFVDVRDVAEGVFLPRKRARPARATSFPTGSIP